jgi:Ig-like domain CHU_C associated
MNRNGRLLELLPIVAACALIVLGSLTTLAVIGEAHSGSTGPAAGQARSHLVPFIAQGGNVAVACSDVDTCTTGAITNVAAGDALVVVVTEYTTSVGAPSLVEEVTTGGDNDLTELGATPCVSGSGHGVTAIYGLADVAAEASVTFTANYPADEYYTIHALDVKGTATSPFETIGTGVCSSAAGTTGTASATTTQDDDLVILGVEIRASTAVAATGGDTLVNDASTTGTDLDSGGLLDEIDPTTGTISLSATFTSASWAAIAIGLKAPPLASGTVSPASAAIDAGQDIAFTTTAATGGTAPITYQWYTATSTSTCSSGTLIQGATGQTYSTPALAAGTDYYCVWATDSSTPANQVVYSNVGTITVNPALSVSITPAAPSIDSGQTVQLTANPTGGTGADTYAWYSGATCTGTVLATTQAYTTPSLTANTTYCVSATDSAYSPATANASATVTVSASPLTVTITPDSPSAVSGKTVQLTAHPSGGTGADTYAWYLGASCSGTVLATTQVFTSPALTAGATYCVAVTDSAPSPVTATAQTTVKIISPSSSTLPPYAYPAIGAVIAVLAALLLLALLARRGRKVTFHQIGLPPESQWSLTFAGVVQRSSRSSITFSTKKGQFAYLVQNVPGYSAAPSSGSVDVGKDPSNLQITFSAQPSEPRNADSTGPSPPSEVGSSDSTAPPPTPDSVSSEPQDSSRSTETSTADSTPSTPTSETGSGESAGPASPSESGPADSAAPNPASGTETTESLAPDS